MDSTLKYSDITDKAYGLVGMAIALVAWDAEEWLESIDLGAMPEEAMHMSPNYYLCFAPRIGAKAVWEQSLKRFQLISAMTVANVTCREQVYRGHTSISSDTDTSLRNFLINEGASLCDLEKDEVGSIYNKSLGYCRRLFSHPGVCKMAKQFASELKDRRYMEAEDIFAFLAPLSRM